MLQDTFPHKHSPESFLYVVIVFAPLYNTLSTFCRKHQFTFEYLNWLI